jgi:hypothetical protein
MTMAYQYPDKGAWRAGPPGSVVASQLASSAVTTVKLAAAAVTAAKLDPTTIQTAVVNLTNAEIKALRAAPKTLVAAPGVGFLLEFITATLMLKAGANVLSESTANLGVRYGDGSGTQISETVEATGFMDSAASIMTTCRVKQDGIVTKANAENKALVLHNLGAGEYGANAAADATMRVEVVYRVWPTVW